MRCKRAKTSPAKQKARRRPRAKRIPSAGGRFGWSDELWALIAPLLPAHQNTQPLGGGRPRAPDRVSAEAILFVLRTGCQWNALSATGLGASSTAHERCQAWREDGFFLRFWPGGAGRLRGDPRHRLAVAQSTGGGSAWTGR